MSTDLKKNIYIVQIIQVVIEYPTFSKIVIILLSNHDRIRTFFRIYTPQGYARFMEFAKKITIVAEYVRSLILKKVAVKRVRIQLNRRTRLGILRR